MASLSHKAGLIFAILALRFPISLGCDLKMEFRVSPMLWMMDYLRYCTRHSMYVDVDTTRVRDTVDKVSRRRFKLLKPHTHVSLTREPMGPVREEMEDYFQRRLRHFVSNWHACVLIHCYHSVTSPQFNRSICLLVLLPRLLLLSFFFSRI